MSPARLAVTAVLLVACSCAVRRPSPAAAPPNAGSPGTVPEAAASAEPALEWHAITFPDATFTGQVLAVAAPSAFRAGDTLVIWVPFTPKAQARCTIVRSELDKGGSIETLVAAPGTVGARLRDLAVEAVAVSPETGMLSLVAKRDNQARVKVAGYRDRRKSLVCAADGAGDRPAFDRVAESLVRSLQPAIPPGDGPPAATAVELCTLTIGEGASGFERTEIIEDGPRTLTRVTSFVAFRDGPAGLDLMEATGDESAVDGRVSKLAITRLFGGRTDLEANLTRDAAGRYRAVVSGRRGRRHDGPVRVKDAEGLPSAGTIRARIKNELLAGEARELPIEIYDPQDTPAEAVVRTYARGAGPDELTVTEKDRVSRELVEADGFVRSAELSLPSGARLSSACHREGPATAGP